MRQVLRLSGREIYGETLSGWFGLQWFQSATWEVWFTVWHWLYQETRTTYVIIIIIIIVVVVVIVTSFFLSLFILKPFFFLLLILKASLASFVFFQIVEYKSSPFSFSKCNSMMRTTTTLFSLFSYSRLRSREERDKGIKRHGERSTRNSFSKTVKRKKEKRGKGKERRRKEKRNKSRSKFFKHTWRV